MIQKTGLATWSGGLQKGAGTISTQSGALKGQAFGFASRFEDKLETNPEELIGAAHAGCYSMFLSALMGGAGITPKSIETTSTVTLDPSTAGSPTVVRAHLVTKIVADADETKLIALAQAAKSGCPISRLMRAEVSLEVMVG